MVHAARELHALLARLVSPIDDSSHKHLQAQVRGYVDRAKANGWPPEKVIVSLKGIVHEAVPPHARRWTDADGQRDPLLDDIVRWSIEYYYEGDG